VPHLALEPGRHLLHEDVHVVLVVHLEDLGNQPGTHAVRLAQVIVDAYLHPGRLS
jgi:hypothetical protein